MSQTNHSVLVGVGSNLDSPIEQVIAAISNVEKLPLTTLLAKSSLYESLPQGPQDQEKFINAVVLIKYEGSPEQLLFALQKIEQHFGRVRRRHWGERVIDLDILFFGHQSVSYQNPDLTIPHPHALKRDFVILPALEIAPNWLLPSNEKLSYYSDQCLNHQIKVIAPNDY